jgi:type IV pilus assembly protein PilB
MIGEIRDPETAKISVEAALTGHLVLSTFHTNNAPAAASRLTEMGVEPFLTSSAVDCVIAQRLARRLCSYCKQPTEIGEDVLSEMKFPFEHAPESGLRFYQTVGCERCGGSGYRGRVGIYEFMIRFKDNGLLKAAQGINTVEEVLRTVV